MTHRARLELPQSRSDSRGLETMLCLPTGHWKRGKSWSCQLDEIKSRRTKDGLEADVNARFSHAGMQSNDAVDRGQDDHDSKDSTLADRSNISSITASTRLTMANIQSTNLVLVRENLPDLHQIHQVSQISKKEFEWLIWMCHNLIEWSIRLSSNPRNLQWKRKSQQWNAQLLTKCW